MIEMPSGNLTACGETDRLAGAVQQHAAAQDMLVAQRPIVGMLQDDGERLLDEMLAPGRPGHSSISSVSQPAWTASSVRHCLHHAEGEGYWDFYRPWTGLMLSVTDAAYRSDTWVNVEGAAYFKVRILLSGALHARSGEIIARAPEALLYVSPGHSREGYYIASEEPVRMIVLHCRPPLLTHVLGLAPKDIPAPLNSLLTADRAATRRRLTSSPEATQVARRIMESRHRLSLPLRDRYLQTLSMELLLQVLGILERRAPVPADASVNSRDAARIYKARDYLAQHYVNPPNITELARRIGLNRTKLKESFRRILGFTIYDYIVRLRLERAAEMLLTGDYPIAQVAYAVGYEYPANFTAAFKRHFGRLPRDWKRGRPTGDPIQ